MNDREYDEAHDPNKFTVIKGKRVPLTETPTQPAVQGEREAEAARYRFLRRRICFTGNGDGTASMHAINLPESAAFPELGEVQMMVDAALDAAIASELNEPSGNSGKFDAAGNGAVQGEREALVAEIREAIRDSTRDGYGGLIHAGWIADRLDAAGNGGES